MSHTKIHIPRTQLHRASKWHYLIESNFFFSISKHQYISKGKRRKAYREYTRRQRPNNKGTKTTKTHQPSTGGYPLQETYKGPGLRTIIQFCPPPHITDKRILNFLYS